MGVKPRIALAAQAGLRVNRGIVVDRWLRSSAANVYALGDCAEVDGQVLYYVAPLMAAAKALGRTLAGIDTAVEYPAMPVTVKTPACPIVLAPPPSGANGRWTIETVSANSVIAEYLDQTGALTAQHSRSVVRFGRALKQCCTLAPRVQRCSTSVRFLLSG